MARPSACPCSATPTAARRPYAYCRLRPGPQSSSSLAARPLSRCMVAVHKASRKSCCPLAEVGVRDAELARRGERQGARDERLGHFRSPALERIQRARRGFVQQPPWKATLEKTDPAAGRYVTAFNDKADRVTPSRSEAICQPSGRSTRHEPPITAPAVRGQAARRSRTGVVKGCRRTICEGPPP